MVEPILRVENLSVDYLVGAGRFHALTDVSFEMNAGEVVGIVGETGCGKSTLGHSIPRLLPEPPARVLSGKIFYRGTDLLQMPKWKMPTVRGTDIGMIFQEPINSLNPAYRIMSQVKEAVHIRRLRDAGRAPRFKPVEPHDYSRRPTPAAADVLTRPFTPALPSTGPGGSERAPLPVRE